jgi:imidazolonepropionase-like amidohydrolase
MLTKEGLTANLVSLFLDTNPDYVDDAVSAAKDQLARKAKQMKRGDLEKLFDSQIATLKDRGVPEQILEALRNGKTKVLAHAETLTIVEGNLAFAPVILALYLGYHGIVSLVRHGGKQGYTHLDPRKITDEEKVPAGLYYHFDIEDGTVRLGKKPEVSDKEIRAEKRLRSTAAEIVSIGIHTDVLPRHYMDAVGSRCDSGYVPILYLSVGRPELCWVDLDGANDHWGAASCGSRLEL